MNPHPPYQKVHEGLLYQDLNTIGIALSTKILEKRKPNQTIEERYRTHDGETVPEEKIVTLIAVIILD